MALIGAISVTPNILTLKQDSRYWRILAMHDTPDMGLICASTIGDVSMANFFKHHGASNWHQAFVTASRAGHFDLVKHMSKTISLGPNTYEDCMTLAAERNDLEFVQFCKAKGATNFDVAFGKAIQYGHLELVKYFVSEGVTLDAMAMVIAQVHGRQAIVDYLETHLGPTSWP